MKKLIVFLGTVCAALVSALLIVCTAFAFRPMPEPMSVDLARWIEQRVMESPAYTDAVVLVDELPGWVAWMQDIMTLPDRMMGNTNSAAMPSGMSRVVTVFNIEDGLPISGPGMSAAVACWVVDEDVVMYTIGTPFLRVTDEAADILRPLCDGVIAGPLREKAIGFVDGSEV